MEKRNVVTIGVVGGVGGGGGGGVGGVVDDVVSAVDVVVLVARALPINLLFSGLQICRNNQKKINQRSNGYDQRRCRKSA